MGYAGRVSRVERICDLSQELERAVEIQSIRFD